MTETQLPKPSSAQPRKPTSPWRRATFVVLVVAAGLAALAGLFVVAIMLLLFFGGGLKTGNK
mgnify:CR=1 FL=1